MIDTIIDSVVRRHSATDLDGRELCRLEVTGLDASGALKALHVDYRPADGSEAFALQMLLGHVKELGLRLLDEAGVDAALGIVRREDGKIVLKRPH